ncbi:hypothetical protein E2C01_040323 [Portunus trituberculatus]|uniref:Uncharacterized protein n=1 Tax=Portunus trituberculatus TaxID=210409 RepID=A0A5B7FG70_PORTR|nr:hypothetical protein [Portunus trituberculatus]
MATPNPALKSPLGRAPLMSPVSVANDRDELSLIASTVRCNCVKKPLKHVTVAEVQAVSHAKYGAMT